MVQRAVRAMFALMLATWLQSSADGQLSPPNVADLERGAEGEVDPIARSIGRAQLARARGRSDVASKEWTPVLKAREAEVRKLEEQLRRGRLCNPAEYEFARGRLAVARAWLAELEGRTDDLRWELPVVIDHLEREIERNRRLSERFGVLTESGAIEANRPLEEDARWARKRREELAPGG